VHREQSEESRNRAHDYEEVRRIIKSIDPLPPLKKQEEVEYIQKAKAGDKDALLTLIRAHLPSILDIASKRGSPQVPLADRVQDGIEGLIDAVYRYDDPTGNTPLLAYSRWRVLMHTQKEGRSYREDPIDLDAGGYGGEYDMALELEQDFDEKTERLISSLSEMEQKAIRLYYGNGPCCEDAGAVAEALGLSVEKTRRLLHTAIRRLRDLYGTCDSTKGEEDGHSRGPQRSSAQRMRVADIKVGRRLRQDPGELRDLVESIAATGLINPLTVSEDGWLLAGWRRLKAVQLLGWEDVDVVVMPIRVGDKG
jgi:RNA polymerase sigma factor (sigma-70 family)